MAHQFDAPIPGEGLTSQLGNLNAQHPPKFTKAEDAMNFIWQRMTVGQPAQHLLAMMDAGVPVETLTRTILFTAFHQGLFTWDMVLKLAIPTVQSLCAIALRAGIQPTVRMPKHTDGKADKELAMALHAWETSKKIQASTKMTPPLATSDKEAIPGPTEDATGIHMPAPTPPAPQTPPQAGPQPARGGIMSPPPSQVAPGPAGAPAPFPQSLQ